MTIKEAIAQLDNLKPNMYGEPDKKRWLSRLDTRIWQDILLTHELNEGEELPEFEPYDVDTSGETELLVGEPYDEMYVRWLEAQVDYANREFDGFNNSNAVFESIYGAFRNAYNQSHMPIGRHKTYY